MKNIAKADSPKSLTAILPARPLRRSEKVAQTAFRPARRDVKSFIPSLNQTFSDSRRAFFDSFRIAGPDDKARPAQPSPRRPGGGLTANEVTSNPETSRNGDS